MTELRSIVFAGRDEVACVASSAELAAGPGEVMLRSRYTCISAGTELAKLTGLQAIDYPAVIGNRAIGRVLSAGSGTGVQPGDLVLAHTPHQSHAVTRGLAVTLPAELDRPDAALLGLAMVAITGVRVAQPELGDTAVVTGAGLVGNLAAQLLELSGVRTLVVDRVPARLEVARRCGITAAVAPDDAEAAVAALTGGAGADCVLECTGSPAVVAGLAPCCARSATVVLVGSPRGEQRCDLTAFLDAFHLWRPHGDLTLKGAHEWKLPLRPDGFAKHSMARNAACLAELMVTGRLHTRELLSAVYRPEQAAAAYAALRDRPGEHLGVVFDWTED